MSSKVQAQTRAQCESDRLSAPSILSPDMKESTDEFSFIYPKA
jgi:hypothetical protein